MGFAFGMDLPIAFSSETDMDISFADIAKTLRRFVKCFWLDQINIKRLLAVGKRSPSFALPSR